MIGRLHFGYTLGAVLVGGLVIASGWTDVHRYFAEQMPNSSVFEEHSAAATFAGHALVDIGPGTRVIVDNRLIGQPTIQFFAPNAPRPEGYAPYLLPLTGTADTALFLLGDQTPDTDLVRRLYPRATIKTFAPPNGDPILLQEALIPSADVSAIQGLEATFLPSGGGAPLQTRVASPAEGWDQLPSSVAVDASFEGALDAPVFGNYVLQVDGPPAAELQIDRQPVDANGQPAHLSLARGIHHLELTANASDASQPIHLLWQPPASSALAPIPASNLFASPAVETGLLGQYYSNGSWSGPAALQEIDPFIGMYFQVAPLPLPFSIEWTGQLAVPLDGAYGFQATAIDSSQTFIDEGEVDQASPTTLSAGWHAIRVRFEAHSGFSHVELRWKPPGEDWQIVPSAFLRPSPSASAGQPLPELPAPVSQPSAPAPSGASLLKPVWQFAPGPGSQPSGVALDPDGNVYVVDSQLNTLSKLDADGQVLWTAAPPAASSSSEQLVAVAVGPDGAAYVLDSGSGVVLRFEPGGDFAGVVVPDTPVYHPRGLAVGPNSDLYLADTGGGRELHLNARGNQLGHIGGSDNAAAGLSQPTGVGVTSDGDVIVVDPAAKKVFHFAASGASLASWDFAGGETVNGPQVAVDGNDTSWVTSTVAGRLEAFAPDGSSEGRYAPASGFVGPSGVAVGDGYVVVAEPGAGRVRKFTLP